MGCSIRHESVLLGAALNHGECTWQVKTGTGLPSGPSGVLGAAEGLSFLGVTSGLIIAALQAVNPSF